MHSLWNTLFTQPIYNTLVFLINNVTLGDVGFAIIALTIIVKFILFPLTKKSIRSQVLMKKLEPELKEIKKKYPNKEEQAKKQFELYKQYGTNPFSGCLVVLLQLPVIFALYYVFRHLDFVTGPLYSFVHLTVTPDTNFLGLIDMASHSMVLAVFAGITQFIQGYLATPKNPEETVKEQVAEEKEKTFQEELASSMNTNMRYVLPVLMVFIGYTVSAAVAIYLITSNIFTIVQEWYVRKSLATSLKENK